MRAIRGENTRPEKRVRSALHRLGYRFRLHATNLPGSPDVVLTRHRTVVFVHGCFWHQHARCPRATTPATRVEFWNEKFRKNRLRDRRVVRALVRLGWRVIIVWECESEVGLSNTLQERLKDRARR
jgi:DNA mismatch endonuclease (patch repair protein)